MSMSLSLSSCSAFRSFVSQAKEIELSAYTLGHGATERALIAAADRGASVRVRLAGTPFGDASGELARRNEDEAAKLAKHGIDAVVSRDSDVHLKAAVVEGHVFLDDRNWCDADDVILTSGDSSDLAATRAAITGAETHSTSDGLVFTKGEALREEAKCISGAAAPIRLQTETLSPSIITKCLRSVAKRVSVRILLSRTSELGNPRTRAALIALTKLGVAVRVTKANDKFCLSGTHAWVGSANASGGDLQMSDWGAPFDDSKSIETLRVRFDEAWSTAKSIVQLLP
jgi:hypothetical protein